MAIVHNPETWFQAIEVYPVRVRMARICVTGCQKHNQWSDPHPDLVHQERDKGKYPVLAVADKR
jgi:hypothetical protein